MNKFIHFVQEAYQELKLASWLTPQQMVASTIVVLILTVIVSLYVTVVDRILLFLASIVLRIG